VADALPPAELRRAYDRSASSYDERFAALQAVKYDAVLERYRPAPQARLLDLGCGTGLLLPRLRGLRRRPVALDLSWEMLRRADPRAGERVQGDLLRLPLADGCLDGVLAITSLLVSPRDMVGALCEVSRVLTRDGTLALTILQRDRYAGLEQDLRACSLAPGEAFPCGQDVGWVCRRV